MLRLSVRSVVREAKVLQEVSYRFNGSCSGVASGKTWTKPSGFDTGLKTFNSLTKQKDPLILARDGVASW